jgi:glycosyltransferase involved in cell wall biosynthesis
MTATLWIDVEDLLAYVHHHQWPSGIQRVVFEISRALQTQYGSTGRVRFVRHDRRGGFREVGWSQIALLFSGLTEPNRSSRTTVRVGISPHSPARQFVRELVYRLPASLRAQLIDALLAQERAFRALVRLLGTLALGLIRAPRLLARRLHWGKVGAPLPGALSMDVPRAGFAKCVVPGDTLLVLGAPWSSSYAALIGKQREGLGLRFALLVYDIVPLRRPEWYGAGATRQFRIFFDSVLPLCDQVFAISQATAVDVTAYAQERGMALRGPIVPIPMGTGFGTLSPSTAVPRSNRLPLAGSYALFVSTIEARKNHQLLFRVWRRLLEELPPEQVPTLVFAGRIGWLVSDLMQQIANTDYLNGKLIVVDEPSDTEIAALYQGCLFTMYPSLYEGWGLPVTESLRFGKPCLIADRTSLPEAGGIIVRQFDPENLNEAYAKIREVIMDPEGLARWEEQVRREFRPVPWTASAEALLVTLGYRASPDVVTPVRSGPIASDTR